MALAVFWICASFILVSGQAAAVNDDQESNIKAILNLLSNGSPDFGINQEIPSDDIVNPPEADPAATEFGASYDLPVGNSKAPLNNMMKRIYYVFQNRCELYGSCMANKGRRRYQKCECPGGSSCKIYENEYICY